MVFFVPFLFLFFVPVVIIYLTNLSIFYLFLSLFLLYMLGLQIRMELTESVTLKKIIADLTDKKSTDPDPTLGKQSGSGVDLNSPYFTLEYIYNCDISTLL